MRLKHMTTLALALCALAGFTPHADAAPEIGQPAPDFEATDINGNAFKLSDHRGKIVVLEWSNHECPFVKKHYDSGNMQKIITQTKDKGAEWVTIVSSAEGRQGNTTADEAKEILKAQGADPSVKILDPSGAIGKMYDAKTTPHLFVIDTEGVLAYEGAIDSNASPNPATIEGAENYVAAAVDSLIAGEEIKTPQTQPYGCSVKYAH